MPATAITASAAAIRSRSASNRCNPATPTSTMRSDPTPWTCRLVTASCATGRSDVPAATTATRPCSSGSGPRTTVAPTSSTSRRPAPGQRSARRPDSASQAPRDRGARRRGGSARRASAPATCARRERPPARRCGTADRDRVEQNPDHRRGGVCHAVTVSQTATGVERAPGCCPGSTAWRASPSRSRRRRLGGCPRRRHPRAGRRPGHRGADGVAGAAGRHPCGHGRLCPSPRVEHRQVDSHEMEGDGYTRNGHDRCDFPKATLSTRSAPYSAAVKSSTAASS